MDQQDKKKNQPQEPEIPEKDPPKGKVLSSDYRELFQALDEKERRQREKAEDLPEEPKSPSGGKKESHRRADPGGGKGRPGGAGSFAGECRGGIGIKSRRQ